MSDALMLVIAVLATGISGVLTGLSWYFMRQAEKAAARSEVSARESVASASLAVEAYDRLAKMRETRPVPSPRNGG